MDEIDLKIINMLWENPRCSFRELADKLNISAPAVHRRFQEAKKAGIILGPYVYLYPDMTSAVPVIIIGVSQAKTLSEVKAALSKGETVEQVTLLCGNIYMVRGKLKTLGQLDEFVSFVQKGAKIDTPDILLSPSRIGCTLNEHRNEKISKLDFKIIAVLRKDGRMSANEISEIISVSPKTVKRHLDRMLDSRIIILSFIVDQSHTGDFVPFLQIYLDGTVEKNDIMRKIMNEYSSKILEPVVFGNKPNYLVAHGWFNNMAEMKKCLADLEDENGIESVTPNMYVNSFMLDTWLETILDNPEDAYAYAKKINP